tara:strand:- start:1030 stop:1146 length:117 start_codon:yes stop_codon:yes gene_type:complete
MGDFYCDQVLSGKLKVSVVFETFSLPFITRSLFSSGMW